MTSSPTESPSLFAFDCIPKDMNIAAQNLRNVNALVQALGHKHSSEKNKHGTVWRNVDVGTIINFLKSLRVPDVMQYSHHPARLISLIEGGRLHNINVARIEVERGTAEKFVVDNGVCWKVCSLANPTSNLANDFYADVRTEFVHTKKKVEHPILRVCEGPCLEWFDYEKDPKTNLPDYSTPRIHRRAGAPLLIVLHVFKALDPETGNPVSVLDQVALSAAVPRIVTSPSSPSYPKIAFVEVSTTPVAPFKNISNESPKNSKMSPEKTFQMLRRDYEYKVLNSKQ